MNPRGIAAVAIAAAACGETIEVTPMVPLEVAKLSVRSVLLSLKNDPAVEDEQRSKALAVLAMDVAGEIPRLAAAAQIAASFSERSRGDHGAALRHLDRAAASLDTTPVANDAVVAGALYFGLGGEPGKALSTLRTWRARLEAAKAADEVLAKVLEAEARLAPKPPPPPPEPPPEAPPAALPEGRPLVPAGGEDPEPVGSMYP